MRRQSSNADILPRPYCIESTADFTTLHLFFHKYTADLHITTSDEGLSVVYIFTNQRIQIRNSSIPGTLKTTGRIRRIRKAALLQILENIK